MTNNPAPAGSPAALARAALVLYIGISLGALVFMLVSLVVNQAQGPLLPELAKNSVALKAVLAAICLLCLLAARRQFARRLMLAKDPLNKLAAKLNGYIRALLLYLVLCEVPVLAAVIVFLLTGDFSFLVFGAVILGFMLAILPVKKRIVQQLELDWQEQEQLEKKDN